MVLTGQNLRYRVILRETKHGVFARVSRYLIKTNYVILSLEKTELLFNYELNYIFKDLGAYFKT